MDIFHPLPLDECSSDAAVDDNRRLLALVLGEESGGRRRFAASRRVTPPYSHVAAQVDGVVVVVSVTHNFPTVKQEISDTSTQFSWESLYIATLSTKHPNSVFA